MKKSRTVIAWNFLQANHEADELKVMADKLQKYRHDMLIQAEKLSSNWKGDNATKYIRKIKQEISQLEKIEKQLKIASSTIKTMAKNTYDADQKSLEIAERRNYN